jgi:predicted RNA-binding Zn ribbon-like protein
MVTMTENAAPGRLDLIRGFINTFDREENGKPRRMDAPVDRANVTTWLREQGLLGPDEAPSDDDLDRARVLREALRDLAFANQEGAEADPEALAVLDRAAARAPLELRFGGDGARLEPRARGVDAALGSLLSIVADAMADGTWPRLKACAKDSCRWAFYDHARNRSGRWCSMAVCGNRVKAQNFRAKLTADTE